MKTSILRCLMALATIIAISHPGNAEDASQTLSPKPFVDGARVTVVGDSITHGGKYPSYVELFYLTRFPDRKITFINCGIIGDSAAGTLVRYDWEVTANKPTVATVMLGMNDVGRSLYEPENQKPDTVQKQKEAIDAYEANMRKIIGRLKADGIEPVIITPSPFDDTSTLTDKNGPHTNDGLREISNRAKSLAREFGVAVIDFHGPMTKINLEMQAKDPKATIIGSDRVHPGSAGHMLMAYLFLKAQQVPGVVASISIKAGSGVLNESVHCKVDQIKAGGNTLSFNYRAESLPYPMDPAAASTEPWLPFTEELNREMLKVTDLPAGNYHLEIDGKQIKDFTAEQLSEGVNLAACRNTPQYQQAEKARLTYGGKQALVLKLRALAATEHSAARMVPHPIPPVQMDSMLDKRTKDAAGKSWEHFVTANAQEYKENKPHEDEWKAQIEEILTTFRAAVQPKPHAFRISPAN